MNKITDLAQGRWPEILSSLAGLTSDQLTDRHQPCPLCGGNDRYRFDDQDGSGSWYCNQCGGKDQRGGAGNGMEMLMRRTGWEFKEAARAVEDYLGIPRPSASTVAAPRPVKPPVDAPPPSLDGASHQWCYTNAAGEQLFWIQRVDMAGGRKLFIHRTWIDGRWHRPSKKDGFKSDWPAPRPVYNLAALAARPDAQVIICEGEKAADHAQRLFPQLVAISWSNGAKSVGKVDWTPLTGRSILLWPDNDAEGRQAMQQVAGLIREPAKLLTIDAPPDAPEKWDIADADWSPAEALAYVKANHRPMELPAEVAHEPAESPVTQPDLSNVARDLGPVDRMPFRPLGFDHGTFYYLPQAGGQVVELTAAQHNKSHFIMLADLEWWAQGFSNEQGNRIDWDSAQNAIMGACIAQGVYNPDRVRGRGAWTDADRVIFHLGNRLIVDGRSYPITKLPSDFESYYFYENAKELLGPAPDALPDDAAFRLRCIAERFRWETPASANMLLGWIVLAPVCGALDWRPHIWVTGGAGTGKTTILKSFMKPLLGGIYQAATGGTTEAGLRGTLKSEAVPVVFDEFEQNEARDKGIVQNVLSLARIASSEWGRIIKGTTSGGANSFEIRSMFCVSSITVALFQKADLDRFCVLPLRKDPVPKDDWTRFEAEIIDLATVENGRRLIARTLQQIPTIKANAKVLGRALAHRFGQRFGDQHGTLLAGAWSLEPGGGGELSLDMAKEWIDQMDWETRDSDESDADEVKCRDTILQHLVDFSMGQKAQLGELVLCVATGAPLQATTAPELAKILGRWGLKVYRKGLDLMPGGEQPCQMHFVAVAHNNRQLATIFRDTQWANNAHRSSLKRLTGAEVTKDPVYFTGVGMQRATLVPFEINKT